MLVSGILAMRHRVSFVAACCFSSSSLKGLFPGASSCCDSVQEAPQLEADSDPEAPGFLESEPAGWEGRQGQDWVLS